MPWVIEGILTTRNALGTINIAPQGPIRLSEERWLLRPFQGSRTLENLLRERCGVFHITDDVLLLAQTAVGDADPQPRLQTCTKIAGQYLADSCQALSSKSARLPSKNRESKSKSKSSSSMIYDRLPVGIEHNLRAWNWRSWRRGHTY